MGSERRQRTMQIKLRVTPEELEAIRENAKGSGLTVPEFLRRLGQGAVPKSKVDQQLVRDLCHAAGNLGRAGGLLKEWMGAKRRDSGHDAVPIPAIDEIWRSLQTTAGELKTRILAL